MNRIKLEYNLGKSVECARECVHGRSDCADVAQAQIQRTIIDKIITSIAITIVPGSTRRIDLR